MARTRLVLLSVFLLVLLNSLCRASDQVAEVRLYAIDCGRMDIKDMGSLFSDTGEYAGQASTVADPCFLIRHPKGTLLWDTGLGDKISENKNGIDIPEFGVHMTVPARLVDQLRTLEMSPSDITYLAFSHFHFDHTGNAGLFSASTWIVNKAELANAAQMPTSGGIDPNIAADIRQAKTKLIDGDYDVFGDGTVRVGSRICDTWAQRLPLLVSRPGDFVNANPLLRIGVSPAERFC